MAMTFKELLERLKREDEVYLLELINISPDELVDAFEDKIEDRQEYIRNQLAEDYDEDPRKL
jgi:hypothetical protein